MQPELDPTERRIVGVLLEKEFTTPDRYPMTVNSLTAGCNQKNNRDPVMDLADFEVEGALRNLFIRGWVTNVTDGGRAVKWKHRIADKLSVTEEESAVLAELLLRGAQQPGELRARSDRMRPIPTLPDLMTLLQSLGAHVPPLVICLGRRDGERAARYDQTLAGARDEATGSLSREAADPWDDPAPSVTPSVTRSSSSPEVAANPAYAALEQRVRALEEIVARLREQLGDA